MRTPIPQTEDCVITSDAKWRTFIVYRIVGFVRVKQLEMVRVLSFIRGTDPNAQPILKSVGWVASNTEPLEGLVSPWDTPDGEPHPFDGYVTLTRLGKGSGGLLGLYSIEIIAGEDPNAPAVARDSNSEVAIMGNSIAARADRY